ncbi:MAG: hypothetical protein U0641_11840 [Anaerolineae bacterium]
MPVTSCREDFSCLSAPEALVPAFEERQAAVEQAEESGAKRGAAERGQRDLAAEATTPGRWR